MGSTPETKITDPEISNEQAYDNREFQRVAAENPDLAYANLKKNIEQEVYDVLSGSKSEMGDYHNQAKILRDLQDNEFRRSALAGVEDSTTFRSLKAVATKLGAIHDVRGTQKTDG